MESCDPTHCCQTLTPQEIEDHQRISEEMHREGHFNNQQHFLDELACRMARKKQQRKEQQETDNEDAKSVVKFRLYRALLEIQIDLLESPADIDNLVKYENIVDALQTLRYMHHDNWWLVDKQDLLQQLVGPSCVKPCKRVYWPLSLDK